jgi:hypothetical protein
MKITEQDRQAARQERTESKSKMSPQAIARLRSRNEEERRDELEEARVCSEFMRLRRDVPNMMHALRQIWKFGPIPFSVRNKTGERVPYVAAGGSLDRMTAKLLTCLESGFVPARAHDIVFMAMLTPSEADMTDRQFEAELKVSQQAAPPAESKAHKAVPLLSGIQASTIGSPECSRQRKHVRSMLILKGKNSAKLMPG